MVNCPNGHPNVENHKFCGECGIPIATGTAICPHGHANSDKQNFCGECGAPIAAPVEPGPEDSSGRWTIDPICQHQYRYWDGSGWTGHVADNGVLSTDPLAEKGKWYPDTWLGIAAGVVAVLLIAGAISAIAVQMSRSGEPAAASVMQADPLSGAGVLPPPPAATTAPPSAVASRVAGVGKPCRPNSSNAVTADGSVAYCERLEDTNLFMWSLSPGDISSPFPPAGDIDPQEDPGVAVCMDETKQSAPQCVAYLQRPSNPGDGA